MGPDTIVESLRDFFSSARSSLWISIFKFHHEGLLDHLAALAEAQPQLEVRAQLDPVKHDGEAGAPPEGVSATRRLRRICGDKNVQMGPTVNSSRPVFELIHQKYAIADEERTLIVTGNWDKFMPSPDRQIAGQEWGIIIEGRETASYFSRLFENDWNLKPSVVAAMAKHAVHPAPDEIEHLTGEDAMERGYAEEVMPVVRMARKVPQFPEGTFQPKRRDILPLVSPANYHPVVIDLINKASSRLCIQQMYFSRLSKVEGSIVPVPDGKTQALLNALRGAHERGVKVDILLESTTQLSYHDERNLELFWEFLQLMRAGMKDSIRFRRVGPQRVLSFFHNKGIIADGRAVVVSSTNWSDFSMTLSREVGVLMLDTEIAGWYAAVFDRDFANAVTLDEMQYADFLKEIRKLKDGD